MKVVASDLTRIAPGASPAIVNPLAVALSGPLLAAYGIVTPQRLCHFLAQAAHETAGFKTLNEYGAAAYFDSRYGPQTRVGRKLGNTQAGDGNRFHGRGIFQCTGRTNYAYYGSKIGVDLIAKPISATDPTNSLKIALEYWKAKGLNAFADRDDIVGITEKINGGHNGLAERKAYLAKAKQVLAGIKVTVRAAAPPPVALADLVPDAPIAQDPAPNPMTSPTVLGTVGTVASSGALGVLSYIESPYALGAFAIVVIVAGFVIWRWMSRVKAQGV